ncbi:cobalamin biosynthesis protein [Burkholderia alba]|uniref:cobalamin biosynthesis protein n=1 Tax=Burkholderia alba TaxID=2683677 RepID=UPI002B054B19|nr:cobalamin biosynthesis protein [Burkholderia alba]
MMRIAVGIGCRAGRSADSIEAAIRAALALCPRASFEQIAAVATLDAKAREPGLLACCARHGWPVAGFDRAALAARLAQAAPGALSAPSPAVRARLGLDGICEPCALLAAPRGALLLRKTLHDGVTVALAGPL